MDLNKWPSYLYGFMITLVTNTQRLGSVPRTPRLGVGRARAGSFECVAVEDGCNVIWPPGVTSSGYVCHVQDIINSPNFSYLYGGVHGRRPAHQPPIPTRNFP